MYYCVTAVHKIVNVCLSGTAHALQEMSLKRKNSIQRQFLSIDKDGSGEIFVYELRKVLKDATLKMSLNKVAALITEFNFNRNGTQEKDIYEFLNIMPNCKDTELLHKAVILRSAIRHELRQVQTPSLRHGHINSTEFRNTLKSQNVKVSEAQFDGMIKDADVNGEGRIQYDKLVLVMKRIERSSSCFFYISVCYNA